MPFSPLRLLLLLGALAFLMTIVQLGVLSVAFDKLGLSQHSAYLLLVVTLIGSMINLPLFSVKAEAPRPEALPQQVREFLERRRITLTGRTVIAVNVGGCVTPVAFCLYLMAHNPIGATPIIMAVMTVAAAAYFTSRFTPGVGIRMPFLVAPVTAAVIATLLAPEHRAPLAYVGGTLGVLIGADLLRLREIRKVWAPVASIGGAGTFDGIFLTGILAVLLS